MDKGRINIARAVFRFGGDKRIPKQLEASILPDDESGYTAGVDFGGEDPDGNDSEDEDSDESDLRNKSKNLKSKNRQSIINSLMRNSKNAKYK